MPKKTAVFIFKMALVSMVVIFLPLGSALADEVALKNNDRISGIVIEEKVDAVVIKTEAMGVVTIEKSFVENVSRGQGPEKKREEAGATERALASWKKEFSAGYSASQGNTRTGKFSLKALVNKERKHIDEWTFKGNIYYSESDKKMDAQKWYGMGRYAYSFGEKKAWYHFFRAEADHDRFADVRYRFIPASGLGYWFYDTPGTRFLAEAALGLRNTHLYGDGKAASDLVVIPRLFFEHELSPKSKFSHDLTLYSQPGDPESYRIHSESALTFSLSGHLGLRLSLIDDYDSDPSGDAKKNDLNLMTSLVYAFGN